MIAYYIYNSNYLGMTILTSFASFWKYEIDSSSSTSVVVDVGSATVGSGLGNATSSKSLATECTNSSRWNS